MMSIARGLANIMTDGQQVVGYPDWFTSLAIVRHFGFLSATVGLFVFLVAIAGIFLHFRPGGRNLYAIGGSAEVARLAGIDVRRYTDQGLCGRRSIGRGRRHGVGGPARISPSPAPRWATSWTRSRPSSSVVPSLSGGVGSMGGTVVGVLIIGVLHNGLNLLGVSPFVQQIVIGLVIAAAVTVDTLSRRRS